MIIYGAGSLGKIVLGELINNHFPEKDICFYDENPNCPVLLFDKYKVLKQPEQLEEYFKNVNTAFFPAIGHPRLRQKATEKVEQMGGKLTSVISNSAFISPLNFNKFEGLFAPQWSGISHNTKIGKSCILHHYVGIGHDVSIGDYASISTDVQIGSFTTIGNYCFIGISAIIYPKIKIGNNVIISAGAIIKQDVEDYANINL